MNWYKIFYWVTVADGVKVFFNTFCIIFTVMFFIACIGYFSSVYARSAAYEVDKKGWDVWVSAWKRVFTSTVILMPLFWAGWVFCPSKKDAIVIIAGGAVGNFITSDSSSRQIPAELTLLIREKMKSEINDLKVSDVVNTDTLQSKTKEELIEILKRK